VVNTPANFRREDVDEAIPGLGRIFERCRQPRPRDRYPSTNALIDDLRKLRRELDSEVDPPAYITELYNDPAAAVSREELAEYKVLQWEKVPSTATFFELPGYRRDRDGRLVPSAVVRAWGVDIAPPDAPTIESEVLDGPDDIELDTLDEYEAVERRRLSPLLLLLLLPPLLLLLVMGGGMAFRFLLEMGSSPDGGPAPGEDEPVAVDAAASGEAADGSDGEAAALPGEGEASGDQPGEGDDPVDVAPPLDEAGTEPAEAVGDPAPQETVEEAPTEATDVGTEHGTLKINAYPSATVYIDGQEAGSTFVTVRGVSLPPGPHSIRMVRATDGFEQSVDVTIQSGETLAVPFRWADEAAPTAPEPEQEQDSDVPAGETEEAP